MTGPEVEITLDPQRQAQAKSYARLRRRLFLVDLGLTGLLLAAWLALGWSTALKAWWLAWTDVPWLVITGYAAGFFLFFQLVGLPLAYYSGFVLPHRFGQSTETLGGWVKDQLLGLALSAVLGLPLLLGLYWLLEVSGPNWWWWAALGYLAVLIGLSYLAPVVLMPLFNTYTPLGPEHAELVRRLTALAANAGTRVAGVFRFDMSRRTRAANAALTGLGGTRRIILGDTLLNEFTPDEVETVIAHELGHHVHHDIPRLLAVSGALTLAAFFVAAQVLAGGIRLFGFAGPADIAALPLLALTLGGVGLLTLPLANAHSRWREREADRYALEATGKPAAFANAFARLANQNLGDADPEPWVVFWFATHPPIRERIAAAHAFAARPHTP